MSKLLPPDCAMCNLLHVELNYEARRAVRRADGRESVDLTPVDRARRALNDHRKLEHGGS